MSNDNTENQRAERARKALKAYAGDEYGFVECEPGLGPDYETAAQDLITDLLHLLDVTGTEVGGHYRILLDRALNRYTEEFDEETGVDCGGNWFQFRGADCHLVPRGGSDGIPDFYIRHADGDPEEPATVEDGLVLINAWHYGLCVTSTPVAQAWQTEECLYLTPEERRLFKRVAMRLERLG